MLACRVPMDEASLLVEGGGGARVLCAAGGEWASFFLVMTPAQHAQFGCLSTKNLPSSAFSFRRDLCERPLLAHVENKYVPGYKQATVPL